jgi:hypothetical protein
MKGNRKKQGSKGHMRKGPIVDMNPIKSKQRALKFLRLLQTEIQNFNDRKLISSEGGDWVVKGFIDIFKNVHTISGDTKVISKLIELMLFPHFLAFADKHNWKVILSREQNHYPDLTFVDEAGCKFALDLKSPFTSDMARAVDLERPPYRNLATYFSYKQIS